MHNKASDTMGIPGGGTSHGVSKPSVAPSNTTGLKGGTRSASKVCGSHPAPSIPMGGHVDPQSVKGQ